VTNTRFALQRFAQLAPTALLICRKELHLSVNPGQLFLNRETVLERDAHPRTGAGR
jgi:hypothetical protein